ncbi:hypothetical protein V6N13_075052 [Hibiscus sabdariffa]
MASTSPPLPSSFLNRRKLFSNFTPFKPFSISLHDVKCCRFRCQIKSFENRPPNWNVDFLSGTEPVHLNSPSPMSMDAASAVKRVCLFYCNETKALAERIAAESDAIELRNINWRTFEGGFPNLFIPNAHGIRGENVAFLASFSSPSVIFEQLDYLCIAETERFYFGDNILPCVESGIPLLMSRLQQLPDSDNISIAFPDDGAWKRFHKQLQHYPTEGEAAGRHVVIVDDLVQSGGTLIECQKALAANGAAKVSAYVTHGIFPNGSWQRFEHDNGGHPETGLTYFWITDSCPRTVKEVMSKPPFEILSLAGSIAAALQI